MAHLTPTEKKLLEFMGDGMGHSSRQLINFLDPFLTSRGMRAHIYRLRPKLRAVGEDIECVFTPRGFEYRYVRKLASAVDGRT